MDWLGKLQTPCVIWHAFCPLSMELTYVVVTKGMMESMQGRKCRHCLLWEVIAFDIWQIASHLRCIDLKV